MMMMMIVATLGLRVVFALQRQKLGGLQVHGGFVYQIHGNMSWMLLDFVDY
jgi:hypothetical protein